MTFGEFLFALARVVAVPLVIAILLALLGIATVKKRGWAAWLGFFLWASLNLAVYGMYIILILWEPGGVLLGSLGGGLNLMYVSGPMAIFTAPFIAYTVALYSYHVNRDLIRSEAARRARPPRAIPPH
jgi:hypothetical protein